jgi:L-Lysine epsilon oxidase N-terminal/L-lysine epsilon oxidase C-terminal domain
MTSTSYEIHPAIGVARVGSSRLSPPDGYFVGPEPDGVPTAKYRDAHGFIKRQAARFRIFECRRDATGKLVEAAEVRLDDVWSITWTVHLANRKGTARRQYGSGAGFRNRAKGVDDVDRALIIDGGARSVSLPGQRQVFDSGRFRATEVPLGEIVMEPDGRLRVLGGFGKSGSDPEQARLTTKRGHFADNNDWFDDTSDGPVAVTVELRDGTLRTSTAWVIVAPPDFAPAITNLVTLYDLLLDRAVLRGLLVSPADPPRLLSFTRHIRPILERSVGYRWVNRYARFGYEAGPPGRGFGEDAHLEGFWSPLADPSDIAKPRREQIVGRLRNPDPKGPQPNIEPLKLMPRITDIVWRRSDAGNVLPLTSTQYKIMQRWVAGDFVNDLNSSEPAAELLPDALDRMALEACVGGPLYPGIEASGAVFYDASRFMDGEPFLLNHDKVRPGEVTQYNAVPWQADFLICQWEEFDGVMPKRLAWWPAQRPDDVFTAPTDTSMVPWDRGIGSDYQDMIDNWDRLGFVVDKGSSGAPFFLEDERDTQEIGP